MSFSSPTIIFSTPIGKVHAQKENGVLKAKNIRYATSKRYGFPKAIGSTKDFVEQSEKTPVCPQNVSEFLGRMIEVSNLDDFIVEESTQFLSITLPDDIRENEKLPVVVWIHGGSYEIGCGDVKTSNPENWVKEERIIVVSVTYRLGIFGFLGDGVSIPPNLGLMDIIEAIKWVKTHISSFGGNQDNICLLGQSSGGDAVAHLLLVDEVSGLFNRAIIQSAPLGLRKNRSKMNATFLKNILPEKDDKDILKMVSAYKKHVPSIIQYGLKAAMPFGLQYGFPPLCTEKETEEKWRENAKNVEILIGLNDDETAFYLRSSPSLSIYLQKGFGKRMLDRAIRLTTEKIYGKPAQDFAEAYSKAGGNVHLFRIHSKHENNIIGAAHCIDLPLLFGNEEAWKNAALLKDIPWSYINENGKKIRKLWADFARTGNISINKAPEILEIKKI